MHMIVNVMTDGQRYANGSWYVTIHQGELSLVIHLQVSAMSSTKSSSSSVDQMDAGRRPLCLIHTISIIIIIIIIQKNSEMVKKQNNI